MKTIYYNPQSDIETNAPFQHTAYVVSANPTDWSVEAIEKEVRFEFSINSYCAIMGWRIFNEVFSSLPMEMSGIRLFESGEETTLLPRGLKDGAKRLRTYAETLKKTKSEKDIQWMTTPETEYRIIIESEEVKVTLLRLAFFLEEIGKEKGMCAEFWV